MPRLPRHIPARVIAALLALMMLAFPAAGSGMFETCAVNHGSDAGPVEADLPDCCANPQTRSQHDESDHSQSPSRCSKCLHACCRAADVVFVRARPVFERVLVSPLLQAAESVHVWLTSDAIFHPPRA